MDEVNNLIEFVKKKEGFSPTAKWDNRQWSYGYGSKAEGPNATITEEEALSLLTERLASDRKIIKEDAAKRGANYNDNQLDALTSFAYNLGIDDYYKLTRDGRSNKTIAEKMKLYNKSNGVVSEGLQARRNDESALFLTPVQIDSQVKDRSYLDYQEPNIPNEVIFNGKQVAEQDHSLGTLWDAAVYRNWMNESFKRNVEEEAEGVTSFRVSTEMLMEANDRGYNDNELAYLSKATSQANFEHREARIHQDKKMKQTLEEGGLTGTGLEMLASVTDPAMIPTLFLGATAQFGNRWRSAQKVGSSFLIGGSQNAAAEYLLMQGDTQRDGRDMMLAFAAGGLFSGGITTAGLTFGAARRKMNNADALQRGHNESVNQAMEGVAFENADKALAKEVTDAQVRKVFMTEKDIVTKLQEEVGSRADTLSVKKVKKLKQEFREYAKVKKAQIEKLKSSGIRPSAINKQVKQLQDAVDRRQVKLDEVVAANNEQLLKNNNLSALQQGKIPKSLQSRYEELKGLAGEFDTRPMKPEAVKKSMPTPTKQLDEEGNELAENLSVGAMQVQGKFSDIKTQDELLAPTDVDEVFNAVMAADRLGADTARISRMATSVSPFRSLHTTLDMAPDNATRGMNIQLTKSGIRTIEGHQSVEEVAETKFFQNTPDYLTQEQAWEMYAKSNGISWFSKNFMGAKAEFDKLSVLAQVEGKLDTNKPVDGDSPVIIAAKARARIYERSLKANKDNNVIGFEKINHSDRYHSVVYTPENILDATAKSSRDEVINLIAKSYETGGIKLSRDNAIRLAETQIKRTFEYRGNANNAYKKGMEEGEFKFLADEMQAKGVDSTTIEELRSSLFNKEHEANMSPRAMFSLRPNLKATSGNIRMVDVIDTSMERVMKYASDAAGNAGLAKHGYHSRFQFVRAMEEARTQAISDLDLRAREAVSPEVRAELEKARDRAVKGTDYDMMRDALSLIFREPLDSVNDVAEDVSKIFRKQTSITRLRSTGLMTIPEYAVAAVRNGAINTLKGITESRFFDLRETSIAKDKFMQDFANTFSATGHQEYLFGSKFYNNSNFDDATAHKLSSVINKVQGKMMDKVMIMNTFRSFQHGGEEAVARSIVNNLKDLAVKGEITDNIRSSLIKVGGLSDEQVGDIIKHFKANKDVDIFDSVRMMDADLHDALSVAARNTIGSSFMRMGIGETVPYANRELGKIATQLLSFTIGSWEKMVVRGVKADGPAIMGAILTGQAALAYISQAAYVYSRAASMEGTERDKYIEKNMEDEGLFWGVMNRVGVLAAPMLGMQMLSSMRLLPDEITATPTKAGINEAALPIVGFGKDVAKASGSAADLISNQFTNEYMTDEERERNWRNIRKVLPFVDTAIWNTTVGAID